MQKLNIELKTLIFCIEKIANQYIKSSDLLIELKVIIIKQYNTRYEEDN